MYFQLCLLLYKSRINNSFHRIVDFAVSKSKIKKNFLSNLATARPISNDLSLDTSLISSQIELVISHLKSRKSDSKLIDKVRQIKQLKIERNNYIVEGDSNKNLRKTLSKEIGILMKDKNLEEIEKLKQKVEQASLDSMKADEKLAEIDLEIDSILAILPNLLDDR